MLVYVKKVVLAEEIAPHSTQWRQTSQHQEESQVTEPQVACPSHRGTGQPLRLRMVPWHRMSRFILTTEVSWFWKKTQ